MPKVLRVGGNRFLFYSNEGDEPVHIHVKADRNEAKFWMQPVSLASNHGFRAHELTEIEAIARTNQALLEEAWHEQFS